MLACPQEVAQDSRAQPCQLGYQPARMPPAIFLNPKMYCPGYLYRLPKNLV